METKQYIKAQYKDMTAAQLNELKASLLEQYDEICAKKLSLDMSRGKPSAAQLNLSEGLLNALSVNADAIGVGGDYRNYGILEGIPEAMDMFAELLEVNKNQLLVLGNASLPLMYDTVMRAYNFGVSENSTPWSKQGKIKFLCPAPGYDRHFAICEAFDIEMIPIKMLSTGPDMDTVEKLVKNDASIKGMWCVPKYSNPDGVTYSDETVRRLAKLDTAADDFRIFYDNAYVVHHLYDEEDQLLNIFECEFKNPDIVYMFTSTSKVTFPGAGVAAFASSENNIKYAKKLLAKRMICSDKVNQMRHVKYFKNAQGIKDHMKKHAAILAPKFALVNDTFTKEFEGTGIARWINPKGGYFISLYLMNGTATRVYNMAKAAGVTLTNVGATYPYGKDPDDSNLRIAPSFQTEADLATACDVLCCCAKICAIEKLLEKGE